MENTIENTAEDSMFETLIVQARNSLQGELTSRTKVVDLLLDLRLAADHGSAVVKTIDQALTQMPGQTTVPNSWWLAVLSDIERSNHAVPASSATEPSTAGANTVTDTAANAPKRARVVSSPPPLPRRRPPR